MPPKKQSAKAITAEMKKRTTTQANEIVSQLKLEIGKSASDSIVKKPAVKKPEKPAASDASRKQDEIDASIPKRTKGSVRDKVSSANTVVEAKIKPPKKQSVKAIASEMKEQTTTQANEIVSQLKLEIGKSASVVKKPAVKKPEKPAAFDVSQKRIAQNEIDSPMPKRTKGSVRDMVSSANTEAESKMKGASNRAAAADVGQIAEATPNSDSIKGAKMPSHGTASSSKESTSVSNGKAVNKKYVGLPKPRTSHGSGYQYEIDCEQVADSIDVKDLRKHLEAHLKVDGKKNNLGSTVSILCEGHKVILKSKTFLPKKSLRFLSKKFLKRNWNIRFLSKNSHAYEYKYVGAP